MTIKLKRIYDEPEDSDGRRYLVDRLWPRGVSKEDAHLDGWFKKVTPSNDLRKWYDHDPDKWDEFKTAYREELEDKDKALDNVAQELNDKHKATFLYAAKDTEHTHAIVLKEVVQNFIQDKS